MRRSTPALGVRKRQNYVIEENVESVATPNMHPVNRAAEVQSDKTRQAILLFAASFARSDSDFT
jgi:hypothetical protein